jgi:hypothetical protein
MQCPRCQFENLPGQARCFKCGSILADSGATITIEPPRLAGWRRPLRAVARSVRGHMPERLSRPAKARTSKSREGLADMLSFGLGLVVGLIPGLPYLLARQFSRIRWLWLGWLVLACTGLGLYGLPEGYVALGLAIAIHAWLMFRHRGLQVLSGFGERVVVLLALVLILFALYTGLPRAAVPGLACVRCSTVFPHLRIQRGDALLMRSLPPELKRGMVVTFTGRQFRIPRGDGGGVVGWGEITTLGMIVGLPGEEVGVRGNAFVVNGRALDSGQYPLPAWLLGREETVRLAGGRQYFVSCDMDVRRPAGVALPTGLVREACVVDRNAIQSRAFMLWWPLSRRAFLRVD